MQALATLHSWPMMGMRWLLPVQLASVAVMVPRMPGMCRIVLDSDAGAPRLFGGASWLLGQLFSPGGAAPAPAGAGGPGGNRALHEAECLQVGGWLSLGLACLPRLACRGAAAEGHASSARPCRPLACPTAACRPPQVNLWWLLASAAASAYFSWMREQRARERFARQLGPAGEPHLRRLLERHPMYRCGAAESVPGGCAGRGSWCQRQADAPLRCSSTEPACVEEPALGCQPRRPPAPSTAALLQPSPAGAAGRHRALRHVGGHLGGAADGAAPRSGGPPWSCAGGGAAGRRPGVGRRGGLAAGERRAGALTACWRPASTRLITCKHTADSIELGRRQCRGWLGECWGVGAATLVGWRGCAEGAAGRWCAGVQGRVQGH